MIKLIPQIEEKIWRVLKKLRLTPEESPEDFIKRTKKKKHRYSSVCHDEKGKKFIFCARVHDSLHEKERMRTEVKIAKVLNRKKINFFPKYFEAEIEKDFEWLKREYFPESVLESKKEIEKLKRKLSEKEVEKICQTLLKIQKIKIKDFPFLKAKKLKKFFEVPKEIEKRKILEEKTRKKIKKLFIIYKKLLKKENKYFCHGDFQIGNLIFTKKKLKVIDLESAMISNFAYDICFLWSRLWREKVRKKILEKFYSLLPENKKKKFEILFPLNAIFLGFHSFCATPKEYSKEMIKKRKEFFLTLIKKAVDGFDYLKKV